MTTVSEDKAFIAHIISGRLLEEARDWIIQNMAPDDVFDKDDLVEWAENNGFIDEDNMDDWAEQHDYVKDDGL
jgi:hypothetical protein